ARCVPRNGSCLETADVLPGRSPGWLLICSCAICADSPSRAPMNPAAGCPPQTSTSGTAAGSGVMLERPDAFNTEITRFLERLPREGETVHADLAPSRGRTQLQQDRTGQTRRRPGNESTP